jgi:hypothetical protein
MDRADGSGGGPFAYYPTTGDSIRDAASESDAQAGQVEAIRQQLEGEHRRMMAAVEGDLEAPMQEAPALAVGNMVQVAQASRFAAGVMRLFADAVDQFNDDSTAPRSVDKLNVAFSEASISDFGLDRGDYCRGGPSAGGDFDADRSNAMAELLGAMSWD